LPCSATERAPARRVAAAVTPPVVGERLVAGQRGFADERSHAVGHEPGVPKLFNLRTDPIERADTRSNTYWDWFFSKAYMALAAQSLISEFLATFKEFPPRQEAARFMIDQALAKLETALSGAGR
jgi:hypothetical protein